MSFGEWFESAIEHQWRDVDVAYYRAHLNSIRLLRRFNDLLSNMQDREFRSVNWSDVAKLNDINHRLTDVVNFAESHILTNGGKHGFS